MRRRQFYAMRAQQAPVFNTSPAEQKEIVREKEEEEAAQAAQAAAQATESRPVLPVLKPMRRSVSVSETKKFGDKCETLNWLVVSGSPHSVAGIPGLLRVNTV